MNRKPRPMRRMRVEDYSLCKCTVAKTAEGGTYDTFGNPVSFRGEVWPAGGKVQAELYGERIRYIRNIRIEGEYTIERGSDDQMHYVFESGLDVCERDGLCLYTDGNNPDYQIISIRPTRPLRLEAEKR